MTELRKERERRVRERLPNGGRCKTPNCPNDGLGSLCIACRRALLETEAEQEAYDFAREDVELLQIVAFQAGQMHLVRRILERGIFEIGDGPLGCNPTDAEFGFQVLGEVDERIAWLDYQRKALLGREKEEEEEDSAEVGGGVSKTLRALVEAAEVFMDDGPGQGRGARLSEAVADTKKLLDEHFKEPGR